MVLGAENVLSAMETTLQACFIVIIIMIFGLISWRENSNLGTNCFYVGVSGCQPQKQVAIKMCSNKIAGSIQ